jgi:PTS system galactitol-specific IIA component
MNMTKTHNAEETWVSEELVILPMRAETDSDAILQLGERLEAAGSVRESWVGAALDREDTFATGLPTPEIGVAIPHTDAEHVLEWAIAVGVLAEPVEFGEMGTPDNKVSVRVVCALAVADSDRLVTLLQRLVTLFQTPGLLTTIAEAESRAAVVSIFNSHLQDLGGSP